MSIRIEIGERYVVTSDSFQFILHEKRERKAVKRRPRNGWRWLVITRN